MNPNSPNPARLDRLFHLLPAIYRQRDAETGCALQMLLRVIAEQTNLVEDDIEQLYDNWFIETCQDWVVPYIGDLIGYEPIASAGPALVPEGSLQSVLFPRQEVANTIRFRRRKGAFSLLEDLAKAVSGWSAQAIEFDLYVSTTQAIDHIRGDRGQLVNLRDVSALDTAASGCDRLSHSIELRQLDSPAQGKYNSGSVAVLVGRLQSYSVTRCLAYCPEQAGDHCYTFSILGNDAPLFTRPDSPQDHAIPIPIRRLAFSHAVTHHGSTRYEASTHFYGEGKDLAIWASGWSDCDDSQPIPAGRIIPADLTDWRYEPRLDHIAVDPQLGRIVFPPTQLPGGDVRVSYHYGFACGLGGGEYPRTARVSPHPQTVLAVGAGMEFATIRSAYEHWITHQQSGGAVIEIFDSSVYEEQLHFEIPAKKTLELRAASGARPVILLTDWRANRPDALTVSGHEHSSFVLDGLLVGGRGIEISGKLETLILRHTTLVPGWSLQTDNRPRRGGEPSLVLDELQAEIHIDHSILGGIEVRKAAIEGDPLRMFFSNSIVDAGFRSGNPAIAAPNGLIAAAVMFARNCTFLGRVGLHAVDLIENTLFLDELRVARRQQGCIRFSYIPPRSRTPQRFHCQPELAEQMLFEREGQELAPHEQKALRRGEQLRLQPQMMSTRFGTPDYCRLSDNCAIEILTGADDRSEMGVYHDLFSTQRARMLESRLQQYVPAGVDTGIIFVT